MGVINPFGSLSFPEYRRGVGAGTGTEPWHASVVLSYPAVDVAFVFPQLYRPIYHGGRFE
jgi:hypothetical protein